MDLEIQARVPLLQENQFAAANNTNDDQHQEVQPVSWHVSSASVAQVNQTEAEISTRVCPSEAQRPTPSVSQVNRTASEIQPCPSETHPTDAAMPRADRKLDHSEIDMHPWSCETTDQYHSVRIQERIQRSSESANPVDVDIESSKDHWSELTSSSAEDQDPESNLEIFKNLKKDPKFSQFFAMDLSQVKLGPKFAEGGQAEIFEAIMPSTWKDNLKYAIKVFKKGYSLRHLQRQWPEGMLRSSEGFRAAGALPIQGGIVLDDDRFGFVFPRYWGDLRTLMDIRLAQGYKYRASVGPFNGVDSVNILHRVALGMKGLHSQGILHRDLKASNVLIFLRNDVHPTADSLSFHRFSSVVSVADYECSGGVIGTGFWRAPEILQELKNGNRKPCFTAEADVYSFGMVCYEILTGGFPLEGHNWSEYDVVLRGKRPTLLLQEKIGLFGLWGTVPGWAEELIWKCWQRDPSKRPTFDALEAELKQIKKQSVRSCSDCFGMTRRIVCILYLFISVGSFFSLVKEIRDFL